MSPSQPPKSLSSDDAATVATTDEKPSYEQLESWVSVLIARMDRTGKGGMVPDSIRQWHTNKTG